MRRLTERSPSGRPRISARPEVGIHQLHQQLQRGRLAGAVGPEKAEDLARLDVERQPIERAIRTLAPEADGVVLRQLVSGKGSHVISTLACCSSYAIA